jgi:hypothetical protein
MSPMSYSPRQQSRQIKVASGRFDDLDYEGFRKLALAKDLSRFERIGFPDSYRDGHEAAIFADIRSKLLKLDSRGAVVLDIGSGCSDLPNMLMAHCVAHAHRLVLTDSDEMLALLPTDPDGRGDDKIAGRFPDTTNEIKTAVGQADVILCYSVIQYAAAEDILDDFIGAALGLLADGGEMLIGDIPNVSMRKRFFASPTGRALHRAFSGNNDTPVAGIDESEAGKVNDRVVLEILAQARAAGAHAFVLPQADGLPMANRREDILIRRP